MQGTRESRLIKKETTYWIFEATRCHNDFRAGRYKDPECKLGNKCEFICDTDENGECIDPACADDDKINDWLEDKSIFTRVLNT